MESKSINYPSLTRSEWELIMAEWKESQQSQKAFCDSKGLSVHTFGYWRNKLQPKDDSKKSKSFTSMKLKSTEQGMERFTISIQTPYGMRINLTNHVDMDILSSVVKMLGEAYVKS